MPSIKVDVTQQRRQQLGAHDNWRHKQGVRRDQRKQAKFQHLVDQHGGAGRDEGTCGRAAKTVFPQHMLTLAILAMMAGVGAAASSQSRTPSQRQRAFHPALNPKNNPTRIAASPSPFPFSQAVTQQQRRRITKLNHPLPTFTAAPSKTQSPAVQYKQPFSAITPISRLHAAIPLNLRQSAIISAGAIDTAEAVRQLFFDYIYHTQHYLPTNNKEALEAYYRKAIVDGTEHSLFIHDQALQDYLEDKLDFVKTASEQPSVSRHKQTLSPVMQQLLSVLTDDIDFSIPGVQPTAPPLLGHPTPLPVSYFANTFRGLHPLSLEKAQQQALSFITTSLQKNCEWLHSVPQAQQLAQALLTLMAPELNAIDKHDPGLHTVQYGSRQWGWLKIGLAVSQQLGLASHTQTIEALTTLGQAYSKHSVPTAAEIARTFTPGNTHTLSIEETILLQMAHAQGFIDLADVTPQNQSATIKQYEQFIQAEFHREIRLANAMAQLEKPMPLRTVIAADILKKAGYDPEQKIQRQTTALGYDGRSHTDWPKLIDVYRDYHISLPAPVSIDPTYRALLKRLPVLNDEFNTAFDTYQRDSVRAVADLLQVQIEPQIGYISSAPIVTSLEASVNLNGIVKHGNTFLSIQDSTAIQYFYIQSDWKLQRLPSTVTTVESLKAWINDNLSAIFHEDRINTFFNLNLQQKAVDALHVDIQRTGDLAGVTTALAEQYVDHTIGQLKNEAYQMGPAEEGRELMRSTFIPFYSMAQNIRNRNYGEALLDGLMDVSGFIPALGQAARLGTTTAKIASKVAATTITRLVTKGGISNAVRAGVSTVSKTQLKQIGTQTGKLAWALLDGFSPYPLPALGAHQLKAVQHKQLNEIAKELKPVHPGLSKQIETVAQQPIAIHNNKWVSTQASIIHARVEHNRNLYQSTQVIHGRTYTIAQLGDQTQVFFKKHKAQDGTEYVTQVNPLTDESYGLHYYLSSKNKIYLTDRTADSLLKEYRSTAEIMQRYPGQKNNRDQIIVDLKMGAPAYLTYQNDIFHIFLNNNSYLIERNKSGMTFIIHPDKPEAKIPVEAADKKWRLPMDEIPSEFQGMEKGHTQSWRHPLTHEKLIITRLVDQDRVVALKHKGGGYREVNWATGESYHQRPLIFKQAEGQFSQASLAGGMKKTEISVVPKHTQQPSSSTQIDNAQKEKLWKRLQRKSAQHASESVAKTDQARVNVRGQLLENTHYIEFESKNIAIVTTYPNEFGMTNYLKMLIDNRTPAIVVLVPENKIATRPYFYPGKHTYGQINTAVQPWPLNGNERALKEVMVKRYMMVITAPGETGIEIPVLHISQLNHENFSAEQLRQLNDILSDVLKERMDFYRSVKSRAVGDPKKLLPVIHGEHYVDLSGQLLAARHLLLKEKIKDLSVDDVTQAVLELRQQSNYDMVKTPEQFYALLDLVQIIEKKAKPSTWDQFKKHLPIQHASASASKIYTDVKSGPVQKTLILPDQGFVLITMKDGAVTKVDGIHNRAPLEKQLLDKGYAQLFDGLYGGVELMQISQNKIDAAATVKNTFDIHKIEVWSHSQQKIDEIFYPIQKQGLLRKKIDWLGEHLVYGREVQKLTTPDQYKQQLVRMISGESYEIRYGLDQGLHVMQQGTIYSCGYTAAAMVLLDHGKKINDKLFLDILTSGGGVFLDDLKKYIDGMYQLPGEIVEFKHIHEWKDRLKDHAGVLSMGGHDVVINRAHHSQHVLLRDPYEGILFDIDIESIQRRLDTRLESQLVWLIPLPEQPSMPAIKVQETEVTHL